MTGATRFFCPLDCGWSHDQPDPDFTNLGQLHPMPEVDAPEGVDLAVCRLAAGQLQIVEAAVRAHLETHEPLDWVQAVIRIKAERDRLAATLRRHETCRTCGHARHVHAHDPVIRADYCRRCAASRDLHDFQPEEQL